MVEERWYWFLIAVTGLYCFAHLRFKLLSTHWHEIRHRHVFHVLPTLFHRIQLWRARWQILKQEPIRMGTSKTGFYRKVRRQLIKDNHHLLVNFIHSKHSCIELAKSV